MNDGWHREYTLKFAIAKMSLNTTTMNTILTPQQILSNIISLTTSKKLIVAFSGGMDSHVLLDLVVKTKVLSPDYQVSALHVHHGISPNADEWAEHCETICKELEIPCTVLWVDGSVKDGGSPEEMAREARFEAFENFLQPHECLLMAHHEADQAETILLRLFRGTGPLGLGGIPEKAKVGQSELIRPLLHIPKDALLQYASENHLQWIEDESNTNTRFDRNFLRHEILPTLYARWPRVLRSVNRSGALCLETATAVQVLALKDLEMVLSKNANNSKETHNSKNAQNTETFETLSVSKLLGLDPVRRKGVIRCWLQRLGFALPSRSHMERIDREVLNAKPGSKPRLKISEYEIKRIKDELSVGLYSHTMV